MNDTPRYSTLRDYLRVIREQRLVIAVMVVICVGIALGISLSQEKKYEATATISFQDPAQQLAILGTSVGQGGVVPEQTPQARAQTLNEPGVVNRVQRALAEEAFEREQAAAGEAAGEGEGSGSSSGAAGESDGPTQKELEALELSRTRIEDAVATDVDPASFLVTVTATWGNAEFAARLANEFAKQAVDQVNEETLARYEAALDTLEERLDDLPNRPENFTERTSLTDQATRLRFLISTASAGRVASVAEVPETPVSPTPVRNALIGLVAGLVIGLVVAFLRDTLDRRLRGPKEIQHEVGFPLVGHVREEAMGSVARPETEGPGESPDLEAFRILRQNLEFLSVDSPLRTVVVTSALPAEGKSTVASSLAFASAVTGKNTLLVECDLRRPCLAQRLGLAEQPGITDYLAARVAPREILQIVRLGSSLSSNGASHDPSDPAFIPRGEPSVVCITAGTPTPQPAELLGSARFARFLEKVSKAYEIVILDTAPLLPVADTLELLPQVDGVVFCVRSGQTTREQAAAATQALGHFAENPTGLVVTGLRRQDQADYGYYSYGYASTATATHRAVAKKSDH